MAPVGWSWGRRARRSAPGKMAAKPERSDASNGPGNGPSVHVCRSRRIPFRLAPARRASRRGPGRARPPIPRLCRRRPAHPRVQHQARCFRVRWRARSCSATTRCVPRPRSRRSRRCRRSPGAAGRSWRCWRLRPSCCSSAATWARSRRPRPPQGRWWCAEVLGSNGASGRVSLRWSHLGLHAGRWWHLQLTGIGLHPLWR